MATKAPAKPKKAKRRFIEYPRGGKSGVRRWLPSWKLTLGIIGTLVLAVVVGLGVAVASIEVPKPNDLAVAQTTRVYYDDGKTEIGRIGEANRTRVTLERISPELQADIWAAEARGYYSQRGLDHKGL